MPIQHAPHGLHQLKLARPTMRAIVSSKCTPRANPVLGRGQATSGLRTQSAADCVRKHIAGKTPVDSAKWKACDGRRTTKRGIASGQYHKIPYAADLVSANDPRSAGGDTMRVRFPPAPCTRSSSISESFLLTLDISRVRRGVLRAGHLHSSRDHSPALVECAALAELPPRVLKGANPTSRARRHALGSETHRLAVGKVLRTTRRSQASTQRPRSSSGPGHTGCGPPRRQPAA